MVTIYADATEEIETVDHEEWMEDWCGELNVAEMAWTGEIVQMACRAAISRVSQRCTRKDIGVHVSFFCRTERRIIETTNCGTAESIEEFWIYNLLDGYSSNILCVKE